MSGAPEPGADHQLAPAPEPAGDDELFAELYPALRRFAAVVASDDLDPDDLLQEAVARTLRGGPLGRLDSPGAYLRTAMAHLASNHDRTRGRERRAHLRVAAALQGDAHGSGGEVYPSDLADLGRLSGADRAVLYLADIERLPLSEVGRILGISAATTRARVHRARRRMVRVIDEGNRP